MADNAVRGCCAERKTTGSQRNGRGQNVDEGIIRIADGAAQLVHRRYRRHIGGVDLQRAAALVAPRLARRHDAVYRVVAVQIVQRRAEVVAQGDGDKRAVADVGDDKAGS